MDLLTLTDAGLCCERGGFHVDPWQSVPRALLTHGHADHARSGSEAYLAAAPGLGILQKRLGAEARIEVLPYGEPRRLNGVTVSFHPAGHVLGSAQLRVEGDGQVWVVSGDYKRGADPTCEPFEPQRCDVFITEATFGLPVYAFRPGSEVAAEILAWWDECRAEGRPAVLLAYALGKAQRILAELARLTDRPVRTHGAVEGLVEVYRAAGVALLPTTPVQEGDRGGKGELILAPPSAAGSPWLKRFPGASLGFASGWMRLRGTRRRQGYDRGFVLSDHADWPSLLRTVDETQASRVLVTHGSSATLARALQERGIQAEVLRTAYEGESDA